MKLTPDQLATIRIAINDTGTPTHTSVDIDKIYDELNENLYRTIMHFLLADAVSLTDPTEPTAPTAPTLTTAPTFLSGHTLAKYNAQDNALLTKYARDLDKYRAQVDVYQAVTALNRSKMEIYKELAKMYSGVEGGL